MTRTNFRKTLIAAALMGATAVGVAAPAGAQQGGYGPGYGTGPGMMDPGMMGGGYGAGAGEAYGSGYGMGMMGPGTTGGMMSGAMMSGGMGYGALFQDLGLTEEQARQARAIRDETRNKQWDLMGQMMQERTRMQDAVGERGVDRAAAEKAFKQMNALREQMFAARLDAQQKLEGVLTPEQRAKLRSRGHGGGMM